MGIDITVKYLGDPEKEKELRSIIETITKEIEGDWRVSVLGDQDNTIWEVKVDGPKGKRWLKKFDGPGAHSVETIAKEIQSVIKK